MTPADLQRLRLALGWSQSRLAKELGVSRFTVSKWERGIQAPVMGKLLEKYLRLLNSKMLSSV